MSTSGGSEKATFTNLDTGRSVGVQFNPKEFTFQDGASWAPKGNVSHPSLTYEKGEPAKVSMDLYFDATRGGGDVNATHVRAFRALLEQSVDDSDGGKPISRPPHLQFSWGGFEFTCVVEKLQVQYLMFRPDGAPVRAKVSVALLEHRDAGGLGDALGALLTSAGGGLTRQALAATRTITVAAGQTLTSIAQQAGAPYRDIARANRIADPMDLAPGTQLVIPGSSAMADVMEAASLQDVAASWSEAAGIDPFADEGGLGEALSGLFDEAGEALGARLTSAADAVADAVGGAVDGVASRVEQAAQRVASQVEDAADRIATRAEQATERVASRVEQAADEVAGRAEEAVNTVATRAEEAVDAIATRAEEATERVATRAEQAADRVATRIEGAADEVATRAEEAVDRMADRAEEAADEIATRAERAMDEVATRAEEAVDAVASRGEEAVDTVAARAEQAVDQAATRAEQAVDEVASRAEAAVDELADRAEEAAQAMGDRAEQVAEEVADRAEEVVAAAGEAVSDAVDDL